MIQREQLITWILRLEADGKEHNGDEIDQHLRKAAKELGYTESDLEKKHGSNRGVFENDGDWAKAEMTRDKLHEIVKPARGKQPNVYRITEKGQKSFASDRSESCVERSAAHPREISENRTRIEKAALKFSLRLN